jgi:predicted GNAT superfamily acetyltransferase
MTALAHSGSYVSGAFVDDELVGATVGLLGTDHLHSHVAGVEPAQRRTGAGYAMKEHQRVWARDRGLPEVRWTYDPLVGRNAAFNLHKLGASVTEYLPDFYGPLSDGINNGDATDRLYVRWPVTAGPPPPASSTAAGVALVERSGAAPVLSPQPSTGEPLRCAVPEDIEALRRTEPDVAAQWRQAVRAALVGAFAAGYVITGISRDGFYTLEVGS